MSTDRYLSYKGRHWALDMSKATPDPKGFWARLTRKRGTPPAVHHFDDEQTAYYWVQMEPTQRMQVEASHPVVKAWIKAGKP